jgi:hypothetical protein
MDGNDTESCPVRSVGNYYQRFNSVYSTSDNLVVLITYISVTEEILTLIQPVHFCYFSYNSYQSGLIVMKLGTNYSYSELFSEFISI